ncbi:bifunctional riboflavin kinase/FAD synthetase [soil metagenome]
MEITQFEVGSKPQQSIVLALGSFDGLHLEDRRVIAAAKEVATQVGQPLSTLLFEPHPRRLLHPDQPPFNLMTYEQRERELRRLGVQRAYVGMFSNALAQLPPSEFIARVFRQSVAATHICVSSRVQFGNGEPDRKAFLDALRTSYGENLQVIEPIRDASGQYINSNTVRDALQRGDVAAARAHLGRSFAIEGPIIHGAKLGRTIGFPTANVPLGEYLRPAYGIYSSISRLPDGQSYPTIAYIGRRPTVNGIEELLEVNFLDFSGNLYGQVMETDLVEFIRGDKTFPDLESLKVQIAADCATARRLHGMPS